LAKIVKDAPKASLPGLAHEALKFFAEVTAIRARSTRPTRTARFQVS
jgi:hypothetical protein